MTRREFIRLLGGAAAAWPLVAGAQQPKMPVVGVLHGRSYDAMAANWVAFRQGMKEAGFVERENVTMEYHLAVGPRDQLVALAADVSRRVSVIVAAGSAISVAAKAATETVPIVFQTGGDPVKLGLVVSLNRPGGNLTGVSRLSHGLAAKQLEVLRELLPNNSLIGVLVNRDNPNTEADLQDLQNAAHAVRQRLAIQSTVGARDIDAAIATLVKQRPGALMVGTDPGFVNQRTQIVALMTHHAMPAIYPYREFVEVGGLMSYDASAAETYRHVGNYTGRVLKGTKPADLPVHQAVKIELVINLKTARALGIEVPLALLARADEVIE